MMVMTAKVDLKKILMITAGVAALILAAVLLLGGKSDSAVATLSPAGNDGRVRFLESFGWDVTASPAQSGQVRIPEETTEVFDRYNLLQKGQGYDLSKCAGKNVMRYVYEINNYPGATQPVYATVLVHKGQVIGGDVTDTSPGGRIRGFKMPGSSTAPTASAPASEKP